MRRTGNPGRRLQSVLVMIVRQFLQWLRTAPSGDRAEATSALARAYLYSDLTDNDRAAAEGAMTMLLDDPSPLVRRALAEVFASTEYAPPDDRACARLRSARRGRAGSARSPLLARRRSGRSRRDRRAGAAGRDRRCARRLPCSVSAAIAEVGCAEACLVLLENPHAEIVPFSLDRIVERYGHLAAIRNVLLARYDLPAPTRQALVVKLSQTLADFVTVARMAGADRAQRITREACEKATVALAAESPDGEVRPLIRHLREQRPAQRRADPARAVVGQCRAVRGGAGRTRRDAARPRRRHRARPPRRELPRALRQGRPAGLDLPGVPRGARGDARGRLHGRAGRRQPAQAPHHRARADALRERESPDEIEPLLTLLRRYAAEAAREEARLFCDELVADDRIEADADWHPVAA